MVDINSVEKSVVALDGSLKSLEETSFKAGIEFQGMLGNVTKAAYSLEGAGKGWTTFSRLVSGSPLWAIQNKFRAYLSILASFEQRSKDNAKAQMESTKQAMKNFGATKKLNSVLKDQQKAMDIQSKSRADIAKLEKKDRKRGITNAVILSKRENRIMKTIVKHAGLKKKAFKLQKKYNEKEKDYHKRVQENIEENVKLIKDRKKAFDEELEQLNIYQYVLEATGSAERARLTALNAITEKQKDMNTALVEQRKLLQEQYAFDESRVTLAKKVAKESAKAAGRGKFRQMLAGRRGKKAEKRKMGGEQDAIMGMAKNDLKKAFGPKSLFNPKQFAGLLFPFTKLISFAKGRKKRQLRLMKFMASLQHVVQMAFKFFVFAIMGIIVFLAFVKGAYEIFKILQEMGLIAEIKEFAINAFNLIMDFFAVIGTFISGDYKKAFDELKPLLDRTYQMLITGLTLLVNVAWNTLLAGFGLIIEFFHLLWTDDNFRSNVFEIGKKVGKVLLAAWLAKTIILWGLSLIGLYAIPIAMFVLISAFFVSLFKKYGDKLPQIALDAIEKLFAFLTEKISDLKDSIFKVQVLKDVAGGLFNFGKSIGNAAIGKGFTPDARATGGSVSANTPYLVGERGSELFVPNSGGQILNNQRTQGMMGNTINITINARDTSDSEMRRIADKIGNMVNNKINRRTSSRTLG
tara:strand:+ start:13274 stop:15343 length:2070 start_codon:yes stop_codon:yes gene_type:complete